MHILNKNRNVAFSADNTILLAVSLIAVTLATGCATGYNQLQTDKGTIGVSFEFKLNNMCMNGASPAISLSNVPEGTRKLKATLKDLNNPYFNHGGGVVEYNGINLIEEGALKSYHGPCPERNFYGRYNYCFTIEAIDSNNKVIGFGRHCRLCGWADVE